MPADPSRCAIVADDSHLMRNVLRSYLERDFAEVHLATNGGEAVAVARAVQAALILLDYRMDPLNGLQACRQIRSLPGYDDSIPIVLLTAYDDERLRREARSAGATHVEPKPVVYDHLMRRIAPHLKRAGEPAPADDLSRGRALLDQRRRIEAEADSAKRRYAGLAERPSPFHDPWRR